MEKNIIEFTLGLLNQIKLYHWSTKSYAAHRALDQLHKDLSTLTDTLVETYLGNQGHQRTKFRIYTESHSETGDILPYLKNSYSHLKVLRKSFKSQSELQNTVDEMTTAINQAIYLLNLN
jgi:DNA-binding ferritin-like protein